MKRSLLALAGIGALTAATLLAQEPAPPAQNPPPAQKPASAQKSADQPKQEEKKPEQEEKKPEQEEKKPAFKEEITVESASKVEQKLVDAPATLSVVTSDQLAEMPAQNMADTLRSVPGANVIQMSARDINLTTRQATSTLATSQLVTVDGRSLYLDFFGLVLWDFVPSPSSGEIKQIEVVRGPASVVWGANAVNGVVNIITKTPRENQGLGLVLGAGTFNRDGGSRESEGNGYQFNGSFSYASALNDTWSYRLQTGYFNSAPYSRPVGTVPLDCHPLGVVPCRDANGKEVPGGVAIGGATFPADANVPGAFENTGTSQPKFEARLDQDFRDGGRITYQGGYSGTTGIVHSGIGPFAIQSGSYLAYGRVAYNRGALHVAAFGNFVNADAPNLLQTDPGTLKGIALNFKTQTYDFEVGNTNVIGTRHSITYGGNVRRNNFDISLAQGPDRTEAGAYAQWEYFVSKFRFAAGARVDKFGNLSDPAFSPRVSVMFKPTPQQSIRASYNKAFVAPSFIQNYLNQNLSFPTPVDVTFLTAVLPPPLAKLVPPPFYLTVNAFGNPDMKAQTTDQWELAYTGTFGGKTTASLALYTSNTDKNINFVYLYPAGVEGFPPPTYYSPADPAVGITTTLPPETVEVDPIIMGILQQNGVLLPKTAATYLNLGPIRNRGIEASIDHRFSPSWSANANYSFQDTPKALTADTGEIPYPIQEVGLPSKHRFNAGVGYNGETVFGNVDVNYASRALWTDVLNADYAGFTDAYTMLNATLGVKLAEGKVMVSLKGTNLANEKIQQHIFGDILKRSLFLELRYFAK